jgi:hypothetical protein
MSNVTPEIWKLIDQMRSNGHRPDALSILNEANAQNISIDLDQMRLLIMQEGKRSGLICRSDFIPAFIASYLKDSTPQKILDCWAGIGEMLSPLVQRFEPSVAIGINQLISEHEVANLLHENRTIDWRLGDPLVLLDEINTQFNAVIGCPPFRCPPSSLTLTFEDREIQLKDDWGNLIILKASLLLDSEGVGFFLVPPSFMRERGETKVYTNLERFGLFIDAALSLPSGTFAPATQIPGLLLIIRRKKPSHLFVGELTSDLSYRDALLKNLKARKIGKAPHLGALVDSISFRSFPTLVAEYEIKELAKGLGLSPTLLTEICTVINLPKRTEGEQFSDLPNAVYLPLIGRSPAVASLANLQIKAQNYIQLVLNPEIAIAEYVANFLNTVLGQKIRESLFSGTYIPKITKSQLVNTYLYLPNLEVQSEVIGIKSIITNLSIQLETLERQLWNRPQKYKETQKAVNSLNHVDNFEAWVESLPFPLASILWAYHADDDVKDKVEHLFLFFEALSQFTAVIMLSAYAADPIFYGKESGAWIEQDPDSKYKDWVLKSTFGGWINLGQKLAKVTRRLKEDKTKQERILELFGRPEHDFLEMLSNKKLFNELDEINKHRNEWKGHGGAANSKEYKRRLTLLESSLAKVRQVIRERWETALLLLPGTAKYSGGIFDYQVKALVGTRTPFKKIMVKTLIAMEDEKLYLLHANQQRPLELLPFIRLIGSPETEPNACYFYNRQDKDQVRWVSYHFDSNPEIYSPATEVMPAISLICPPDDSTGESTS